MAKCHLNSFHQQKQNRIAEQASRYYQQHKNSPVIDDEAKDSFMTEDEKLMKSIEVTVDCSSLLKKLAVGAANTFRGIGAARANGGTDLKCSKPPPIRDFIQNRINKKSRFSGQHQQKDQKRPQTVVIKKQP